ncbi:DUF6565 domain-containing protein [Hymenobacter cellulosilyticus]|uniref:DUF6565 domain-containing protein n=1 Tax=Hymenobacter cellulosilyticus TaxID=2932248 RepID=A0A8T9Q3H4_9BACT|nr:DUF6565 domain-containing protein [Hymenobacter cellulosilyticus]UOQ70350.1 hypothetical protein MUN79_16560 [Hymenobacter cellulosilyticus]
MFKKHLSIHALATLLLLGGATFTQTSCSQADKKEVGQESDQAYEDFKTFVSTAETQADNVGDKAEADYERETTEMKSEFDAKVAAVDKYADQYDDTRRQEIEQLRTRYTTAYDKRDMAWKNRPNAVAGTSTGGTTTRLYESAAGKYGGLTAANIRGTYEAFTAQIKQNEDRYGIEDWRTVNADWKALDDRYDQIKNEVSTADRAEIAKEKAKYAAFKSYDKTEARVAQGADAVRGEANEVSAETRDERQAVGTAAANTAADVKDAGKSVGQKIGNAAKKVGEKTKEGYKEVKSEVKNTDND